MWIDMRWLLASLKTLVDPAFLPPRGGSSHLVDLTSDDPSPATGVGFIRLLGIMIYVISANWVSRCLIVTSRLSFPPSGATNLTFAWRGPWLPSEHRLVVYSPRTWSSGNLLPLGSMIASSTGGAFRGHNRVTQMSRVDFPHTAIIVVFSARAGMSQLSCHWTDYSSMSIGTRRLLCQCGGCQKKSRRANYLLPLMCLGIAADRRVSIELWCSDPVELAIERQPGNGA
ncbi:hypothetical protein Acr_21g0007070 [Actinidia rufa]|uniref:Uncharacterized protein n=1 Tax=Actinidia rufa TaxID=165716 RepID=A0A7J0GHA8_9ERIC|nr:hypothetical protein Acr_21g0007070 [Actinidia rufa]